MSAASAGRRRGRGDDESWLMSYADLITNLLLFFVVLVTAANLSKGKMQQIAKSISGQESSTSLESVKKALDEKIAEKKLQEMVKATIADDAVELSLNSGLVFDSGRAEIRPENEVVFQDMLALVVPYKEKYRFSVEGHTDSTPIAPGGPYPTNWELAAARAIVVRGRLETLGIDRARMRVEAYADTKPLPPEELAGLTPEQIAARHRRVVVRMY